MSSKRGPAVLVADARRRPTQREQPSAGSSRLPMRYISVDNILQHASEIPSGQPRTTPQSITATASATQRPGAGGRNLTARHTGGAGGGRGLPLLASGRTGQQNVPSRTTKVSEKLVLLPDAAAEEGEEEDGAAAAAAREAAEEEQGRPLRDEELDVLRKRGGIRGKSYAERLPKRARSDKVARLTAYSTAQAYKMKSTAEFLRVKHEAKTKLYDDCLYTVYHLPLLPGADGRRVRSRPILKTPGTGKTVLDLEIERSERRDEHMGYFEEYAPYSQRGSGEGLEGRHAEGMGLEGKEVEPYRLEDGEELSLSPVNRLAPEAKNFAEMFVFSYGVVVFWNFTEQQEKGILADLTFAENETGMSLVTRPLEEQDFETEEFHFEYSNEAKHPRVFNDMITLLPRSDHMVKLTISHAIAQSTKLCFFEERMSQTMQNAQHVPKLLARTGELNMTRAEILKIMGRLFKSRVDINLSSNILDVPNFFWDSEPTLHPLYVAIREYLEIDLRITVLNERCRVFLDLAEILSDSVADSKMSFITWIIIILIVVSILVTVTEVMMRFRILEKEKGKGRRRKLVPPELELRTSGGGEMWERLARANISVDELRDWTLGWTDMDKGTVCGGDIVARTFAGV